MEIAFVCYATIRDAVGRKSLTRDVPAGATVGDALSALADDHEGLGPLLFDGEGSLRPTVNVLVGGENVRRLAGAATELSDGDTVTVAPGVAGGARAGTGVDA